MSQRRLKPATTDAKGTAIVHDPMTHSPETLERLAEAGLDPQRLPRHIAIIMDGNGRWAKQRGLPRIEGHRRGVGSVRTTVVECCRLGVGHLTIYCLSS